MGNILISGSTDEVMWQMRELKKEEWKLKQVTVFFDNSNFLITKYKPENNGVHLILEMEDHTEIHVESANCGYAGSGPNATVSVLEMFGLNRREVEDLIFNHDAVSFQVKHGMIQKNTIDIWWIFFPSIRYSQEEKSLINKIEDDRNVSVDLEKGKVLLYNPQRTCWNGFLNLLSYMEDIEMEYYLGDDSPLEGGLYLGKGFDKELRLGAYNRDIRGIEHVNLVVSGSNFSVVCLIDRACEMQVIEATYLALTGQRLFDNVFGNGSGRRTKVKELLRLFKGEDREVYKKITINRNQSRTNRRRLR